MRVAANLGWLFSGPIRQRAALARAAGFTAVESPWPAQMAPQSSQDSALEDYRAALKEEGLEPVLLNAWGGDDHPMGVAADPALVDLFRTSFDASLQYARTIGCNKIHVMSGMVNPNFSSQQHLATLRQNLEWAGPRLGDDVTLMLEPISSKPGYFMDCFDKAVQACKGLPYCKLQLDIFHLHNIKGAVTKENLLELLPHTGHLQFSQPGTRAEPSLGGTVEWRELVRVLLDHGYRGDIGAEYSPSCPVTPSSLQWVDDVPGLSL